MIFFMHLIGMNSIKNKMTLASRLDTTCRVLLDIVIVRLAKHKCVPELYTRFITSTQKSSKTKEIRHDPRWQCHYRPNACGRNCRIPLDLQGESVNKFNRATIEDFKAAIAAVKANNDIKGLVVTSGKSTFIVGADITEFGQNFAQGEKAIVDWLMPVHEIFNSFEDLDLPKVAAINGMALGGGFEMCLVCDYRVMSEAAQVGLPEIKLGIYPGFGGSVRLSRLIGIDNAVEWMAMATPKKPAAALKDGAVDAVVAADKLLDAATDLVKQAISGRLNWKVKRQEKLEAVN